MSGPYIEVPECLLKQSYAVRYFPELLHQLIDLYSELAFRTHYPDLFVEPKSAIERVIWGQTELGYDCRLTPDEISMLMR